MTLNKFAAVAVALLSLAACGDQGLHLKVHYRDASGLNAGAPVVKDAARIGSVKSIEADPKGGFLVGIALDHPFAGAATAASRFYLADSPQTPGTKQIEIEQTETGGAVLPEGTVVEGSERFAGLAPFGEFFRQFGEGIKGLRGQLEQFQQELRKVPDSDDAKRLREEWRKLTDEIQKAQSEAEESVKRDVLPRLQEEMDRLREQFREFQSKPAQRPAPPRQI